MRGLEEGDGEKPGGKHTTDELDENQRGREVGVVRNRRWKEENEEQVDIHRLLYRFLSLIHVAFASPPNCPCNETSDELRSLETASVTRLPATGRGGPNPNPPYTFKRISSEHSFTLYFEFG